MLVLVFAAALAAVWLTTAAGPSGQRWRDWHGVAEELESQQRWLGNRDAIEARAVNALKNLEPGRTLDATHLMGEMVALSAQAGLSPAIDPPRTQRTDQFAYHTVSVNFRRAELGALVALSEAIGRRAPYLAIEQCVLSVDRANPSRLNASFVIFSVEVLREAPGP